MWPRAQLRDDCGCCTPDPPQLGCERFADAFTRPDSDTVGHGWTEVVADWDIAGNALVLVGPQTALRVLRQDDATFGVGEQLEDCRSVAATFQLSAVGTVTVLLSMDDLSNNFVAVYAASSTSITMELGAVGTGANETVTFDVDSALDTELTVVLCWNEAAGKLVARMNAQALTKDWTDPPTKVNLGGSAGSGTTLTVNRVRASKTLETDPDCPECPVVDIPPDPEVCTICLDGVSPAQVSVTLPAMSVGAGGFYGLLCRECDMIGGTYLLDRCYGTNPDVEQCYWCTWFENPTPDGYCSGWIVYFFIEEAPGSGHDYRMVIGFGATDVTSTGFAAAGAVWEKYFDGDLDCLDFDEDVPFSSVDPYGSCALPGMGDANAVSV